MKTKRSSKGMSLLIVLAFIVIISVLVVGFAESMRLLRPTAVSHLERARADQFARSGLERVIATLNQQTADTNRNWASQPGQLLVGSPVDDGSTAVDERKVLSNVVPLHSGTAVPSGDPVLAPPNLNVVTYRDPNSHLLTETLDATNVVAMPVAWIYVRQSGAIDTNSSPSLSASDPIVGRYAYWADDESSKINYNIAWGRTGNTNAPGHPTRIELTALTNITQSYADILRNFVTRTNAANVPYNFFNTPLDARRIEMISGGAGVAAALRDNKFDVTHFNSDPNTTFFNEPRIVLTTRPNLAGWTKATNGPYNGQWVGVNGKNWADGGQPRYLRILKDPEDTLDPGLPYSIAMDTNRLSEAVATLALRPGTATNVAGYLQRSDWPMVSGTGSLQSKYFSGYPTTVSASGITAQTSRLGQIAVNILDYVRAKESTNQFIQPIIGSFNSAQPDPAKAFVLNQNGSATNGFQGLSRGPRVTEIGVWYGTNSGAAFTPSSPGGVNVSQPISAGAPYYLFKVEVFLPPNYGLASYDLANVYLGITVPGTTRWVPNYSAVTPPNYGSDSHKIYAGEMSGGTTLLTAGNYAVISRAVGLGTNAPPSPVPATTGAGSKVYLSGGNFNTVLQLAPANSGLTNGIPIETGAVATMKSLEVDDPRLNQHPGDWVPVPGNSFGSRNSRWSAGNPPPLIVPEVDTDGGVVSDASLYMPPPKGSTFTRTDGTIDDNTRGQIMSVGELGYIHTGAEPCAVFGATPIPPGVPWRTLRLQPSASGTNVVPDWAIMDLFTAPVAAPNPYNKYVYAPHDTGFGGRVNLNSSPEPFSLTRTSPLAAVLQNNTYDSTDFTRKLGAGPARDIADNIFNRTLATTSPLGKQYGYAGGYDSPGEVVEVKGIADGGEKSEELVRQIMNLVTTRGNVFSVYTIGQAIKQAPDGRLIVTAQQRAQAMIERYVDPANNSVRFSPVYFRNLSP